MLLASFNKTEYQLRLNPQQQFYTKSTNRTPALL